jgi:outer membrane protein assembly factor BamD
LKTPGVLFFQKEGILDADITHSLPFILLMRHHHHIFFSSRTLPILLLGMCLILEVVSLRASGSNGTNDALTAQQFAAAEDLANTGQVDKAVDTYRFIAKTYPRSKEAPEAQFQMAKQLQKKGDFEAAFNAYQEMLKRHPETTHFEDSVVEEINIANAYLNGRKVTFLGIKMVPSMEKAEEMYNAILKVSPYSKHAAVTQFNLGLAIEKQGRAQEAIAAYQKVIDKYPNSAACASAAYQVGYVYQRLGMTGKSQDLSALKESQNNYQDFLIQYPNSEKVQQAGENMKKMVSKESADTLRIAHFYDFSKDYKAASIYYNDVIRRFPQSEDATAAKTRIDELKSLYGEDALRVGQERPETGERVAERRRLQAQVESTALANYNGPPKKDIVPEELPLPQPQMKGDMTDAKPIPLQEPPAQTAPQRTPLAP